MLPKKNRLKKKKEIEAILKKGLKKNSFSVLIYCSNKKNDSPSQFTFSVPKRIAKKAVCRNRIKRHLREIFRQEILKIIPKGYNCLIIAKKEIINKKYKNIKEEIINLFKKRNNVA